MIEEKLKQILSEKFAVDAAAIQPDATLESLGLDSLDYIEMLFEVEEAFDIRVPQEGAASIKGATVRDVVESIGRMVQENAGTAEPAQ